VGERADGLSRLEVPVVHERLVEPRHGADHVAEVDEDYVVALAEPSDHRRYVLARMRETAQTEFEAVVVAGSNLYRFLEVLDLAKESRDAAERLQHGQVTGWSARSTPASSATGRRRSGNRS